MNLKGIECYLIDFIAGFQIISFQTVVIKELHDGKQAEK